jgi:hypothetical protein
MNWNAPVKIGDKEQLGNEFVMENVKKRIRVEKWKEEYVKRMKKIG